MAIAIGEWLRQYASTYGLRQKGEIDMETVLILLICVMSNILSFCLGQKASSRIITIEKGDRVDIDVEAYARAYKKNPSDLPDEEAVCPEDIKEVSSDGV
jgi:hypothetical protein